MTHTWKIGDWCDNNDARGFIYKVDSYGLHVVYADRCYTWDPPECKPLPHCDSWDWQPPSPPDPGEGYRAIDPAVDVPQDGDEIWVDDRWLPRPFDKARLSFGKDFHYRRKLPAYAPFTAESFKPHRDRWIRWEGHAGAFQINNYDESGYLVGTDRYPWSFLLEYGYTFDDTNTPCGVPQ